MKVVEDYRSLPLFDRSKWQRVRFGDVVKQIKEQVDPEADGIERYVAGEHMETEGLHIRKWGTVGDGYLGPAFIRGFRKGQVLYGSRRTYLKKVAVTEWDGVTANTTFVLETVKGKMLQELLPWLMLSERFTKHSVQESKGSTNPYINFPDIAKFEFDLPPLDQQRRIAEILWAVDEAEQAQIQLRSTVSDARETWLKEALEGQASCKVRIEELGKIITGTTPKTAEPENYDPPEHLFVSPADISEPRYVTSTEKRISKVGMATGRPIPRDAVMVVCIGSTIGKVAMAAEACLTNQQINTVVCLPTHNPLVVYYSLQRQQNLFRQVASCTAVPILNKGNFAALEISFPRNGAEESVAERLLEFERAEECSERSIRDSQQMKTTFINSML